MKITEKTKDTFGYRLVNHDPDTQDFGTYEAFYNYNVAVKQLGKYEDANTLRPVVEWNEDISHACLFWKLPIVEPPMVTNPLSNDWIEDYFTHFTKIIEPDEQLAKDAN